MAKSNAAVAVTKKMDLAVMGEMFDLKSNMEGVEARLPQIKIIHQAQLFETPDGEKAPSIEGIILDINRINAFWEESFDTSGGGTPPDCYSMDGITPDPFSSIKQSNSCTACEQNKFGSDGGRGKSCKNMKRIHLMIEGDMLPYRLTIPPSNLKAVDLYVSLLTSKGIPYQLVKTKLSLKQVTNKDGIAYSELVLINEALINDRVEAQRIKNVRQEFMNVMRGQAIKIDDEL